MMPPLHLSCPPYSYRVYKTESGLEDKTLNILAKRELVKDPSLLLI